MISKNLVKLVSCTDTFCIHVVTTKLGASMKQARSLEKVATDEMSADQKSRRRILVVQQYRPPRFRPSPTSSSPTPTPTRCFGPRRVHRCYRRRKLRFCYTLAAAISRHFGRNGTSSLIWKENWEEMRVESQLRNWIARQKWIQSDFVFYFILFYFRPEIEFNNDGYVTVTSLWRHRRLQLRWRCDVSDVLAYRYRYQSEWSYNWNKILPNFDQRSPRI